MSNLSRRLKAAEEKLSMIVGDPDQPEAVIILAVDGTGKTDQPIPITSFHCSSCGEIPRLENENYEAFQARAIEHARAELPHQEKRDLKGRLIPAAIPVLIADGSAKE